MNSKLFAIKIPEIEKNAMDYVSSSTNNTLSKIFYKSLQNTIYTDLGLILLYKIDMRDTTNITHLHEEIFNTEVLSNHTLPIIEDFVGLMLDKKIKTEFWSLFKDITVDEKEFLLYDLNMVEIAQHLGREYISKIGNFDEIDLNLARTIFFNYMLMTYFNVTAVGSIQKLNQVWMSHQLQIKNFQNQIISKYLSRFQLKKVEPIKVDEIVEVSEYID